MGPSKRDMRQEDTTRSRTKPHPMNRQSSRQGSAKDRHGVVFDDSNGSTIRAVTPETMPPAYVAPGVVFSSNTASPKQQSSHRKQIAQSRNHSGSVSNTDDESTIDGRRRKSHARSATRDDLGSDASPGSFISKTRKRLGSITTNAAVNAKSEGHGGSIGFPSVVHQAPKPPQFEFDDRHRPGPPRRTFSPDSVSTLASGGFRSPPWLDTDSARILQLMKTTCGRMHGILLFRPVHSNAWASGYCSIQVAPGSLVCQVKGDVAQTKILIPDLRGCSVRTHYDSETQSKYLSVQIVCTGIGFQLRPSVPETFDSWLAALLCWQPLRPRGIHNKMTKPQAVAITAKKPTSQRRTSELGNQKSSAAIKVGQSLLWNGPLPSGSQTVAHHHGIGSKEALEDLDLWRGVTCKLLENGTFKLLFEDESSPPLSIALSQLARCAVQRLHESILGVQYCIAIYPQHTIHGLAPRLKRPTILSFESRPTYEAWFFLLRALTVPELYGPEQANMEQPQEIRSVARQDIAGMFRVERRLMVKIVEASFSQVLADTQAPEYAKLKGKSAKSHRSVVDVYADVLCGQDLRARTSVKSCSNSVFWAEEFVFEDLPSIFNRIAVVVRMGHPGEQEWMMVAHGPYDMEGDAGYLSGLGGIEISSHDSILGKVDVLVEELEHLGSIDKRWPIVDGSDRIVGQMLMRVALQETVVLMNEEYNHLSSMLLSFTNGLTMQIAQALAQELKQLSDLLLDIFQATDRAHDWLSNLIEEEIDGIYRETPPTRMRFSGRLQSTDSYDTSEQRELLVRDLSRSATMEANLLFRGNSLVTKALDAHMRRLGSEYLQIVLGKTIRAIAKRDPDCEVDPGRMSSPEHLDRNWSNLLQWTSAIWRDISRSAELCPPGLRLLFKHIRSCAEDRYGSFIRTVKYTSVSGFLFLRFFCPAILNPKLFGLLPEHSVDRTKRAFTLIAKSLNALANMAKFGTKETWMEPMNKFLTASTPEFKTFVDDICAISSSQLSSPALEPQYAAPTQIKGRLTAASREGLSSLPYLLDFTKLLADLVNLWTASPHPTLPEHSDESLIARFGSLCLKLKAQSKECFSSAELAEKPDSKLESRWHHMLSEQQKRRNVFDEQFVTSPHDPELTALPQPVDVEPHNGSIGEGDTTPSSAASAWERRLPLSHRQGENNNALTNSTNSSTVSFEAPEERNRALPGSRDGSSKNRLFDLMSSSGRRKGRDRGGNGHDDGNEF